MSSSDSKSKFRPLKDPASLINPRFNYGSDQVLHNAQHNKYTAFPLEERKQFNLRGLVPPVVEDLDAQKERAYKQMLDFDVPINRYIYLNSLQRTNSTLFYHLLISHIKECLPVVYTPTVGEACETMSAIVRGAQGMYLSAFQDKGEVRSILDNWPQDVDIIVVTDGSRILGLGDLGVNGMGIPIGKLSLYVAAAGLHPARTLPITLDVGTNNEKYLNAPHYLGTKQERIPEKEFVEFTDEFVAAVKDKWPNCLIQWEDFSTDHAFNLLAKHRNNVLSFNDDIQGTGAVVLAGFIAATKVMNIDWKDHRLVFLGAGSAGVGIADMMRRYLINQGLTEAEAKDAFYLVDSKGLITTTRGDKLAAHKVPFAREDMKTEFNALASVVDFVKPTCLFGLSTIKGAFTDDILKAMGTFNKIPFICPLSNPTAKAECTAKDAYTMTEGRCVFAAGSPFDPVVVNGKTLYPGQGNNLYIFPGLGLGALCAKSKVVSDEMIMCAAETLASLVTDDEFSHGLVYPSLGRIREISYEIAVKVAEKSVQQGYGKDADFRTVIKNAMWIPKYYPLRMSQ